MTSDVVWWWLQVPLLPRSSQVMFEPVPEVRRRWLCKCCRRTADMSTVDNVRGLRLMARVRGCLSACMRSRSHYLRTHLPFHSPPLSPTPSPTDSPQPRPHSHAYPYPVSLSAVPQVACPSSCFNTVSHSVGTHVDPSMHELMDSAWAMYQRCLHTFLGAVMLSFVPVAVAVFSGLTCHPQSTRSLGGGTWYGVCGVVGETSGLRITETQFVVIMVLATVFLITVVLGVPAVLLRVLVFDQVRSRFRDLYFWRRYGLAYTLFTDKRCDSHHRVCC